MQLNYKMLKYNLINMYYKKIFINSVWNFVLISKYSAIVSHFDSWTSKDHPTNLLIIWIWAYSQMYFCLLITCTYLSCQIARCCHTSLKNLWKKSAFSILLKMLRCNKRGQSFSSNYHYSLFFNLCFLKRALLRDWQFYYNSIEICLTTFRTYCTIVGIALLVTIKSLNQQIALFTVGVYIHFLHYAAIYTKLHRKMLI